MSETHVNAFIAELHEKRKEISRIISEAETLEAKIKELGGEVPAEVSKIEPVLEAAEAKSGLFGKKPVPSN